MMLAFINCPTYNTFLIYDGSYLLERVKDGFNLSTDDKQFSAFLDNGVDPHMERTPAPLNRVDSEWRRPA